MSHEVKYLLSTWQDNCFFFSPLWQELLCICNVTVLVLLAAKYCLYILWFNATSGVFL